MMSEGYTEKCGVKSWFWWRSLAILTLFLGGSALFFYDWKIGYPEDNYRLVQYQTFDKARQYFLKHEEFNRTPDQWSAFSKEQELEHYQNKKIVSTERSNEFWPIVLRDYNLYKRAFNQKSQDSVSPVLWDEYLQREKENLSQLRASFSDPLTKENKRALKQAVLWDEPMPEEYKKGEYDANYRLLIFRTFQEAERLFSKYQSEGKSEQDWVFLTACRGLAFDQDASILPEQNRGEKWPEILSNHGEYYKLAENEIETSVATKEPYLWKEFTSEMKWEQDPPDKMHTKDKISEQLYVGVIGLLLALLVLGYIVRMKGRFIAVDNEAYYAPGKIKIPYEAMEKIDKRKWENKGLATIYYKDGGKAKKVKVDGMVYGQFKKEDGAPAERLFQVIMANFKGSVIEFVTEDESPDSVAS